MLLLLLLLVGGWSTEKSIEMVSKLVFFDWENSEKDLNFFLLVAVTDSSSSPDAMDEFDLLSFLGSVRVGKIR